ncbi:hypothetical protein [Chryseobacterium sp.]|uniref:hypothetical protein n=1 Tax=Chryseobacterium sp. TaxID=1871047 RepID=UPI00321B5B6B
MKRYFYTASAGPMFNWAYETTAQSETAANAEAKIELEQNLGLYGFEVRQLDSFNLVAVTF